MSCLLYTSHVAVDAQNPFSFFCNSSGEGGAVGGFSRSALPGHNCEEFTPAPSPPMPEYHPIIKGFFTKSKRNFALLEMVDVYKRQVVFRAAPLPADGEFLPVGGDAGIDGDAVEVRTDACLLYTSRCV